MPKPGGDPRPTATTHASTDGIHRGWALFLLCTAQFMVVLDATIVNVALPAIQRDLGFASAADLQYTISLYALTLGGTLILAGRLGDLFGRRRMLVTGLLVFAAASLVCGAAPTPGVLLGARALQGVGSALMSTPALAMITSLFREGPERHRALGAWGGVGGAAGAAGLLVGGILTEFLGWPWVFWLNVPLGIACVIGMLRVLPGASTGGHRAGGLDLPGAVALTTGLFLLILGLGRVETDGPAAGSTLGLLGAAVVVLAVFGIVERRVEHPLVDFRLFTIPGVAAANVCALLLTTVLASGCFFATLYVQETLGFSPPATGAAFLPHSAAVLAGSALASRALGRHGPGRTLAGGFVALATAAILLTGLSPQGSYVVDVLPGFTLLGFGIGICMVAVTVAATASVAERDHALASGVVNTAQQIGFAVGIAAVVSVATAIGGGAPGGPAEQAVAGYGAGYVVDAVLGLVGVGLALVIARATRGPTDTTGTADGAASPTESRSS